MAILSPDNSITKNNNMHLTCFWEDYSEPSLFNTPDFPFRLRRICLQKPQRFHVEPVDPPQLLVGGFHRWPGLPRRAQGAQDARLHRLQEQKPGLVCVPTSRSARSARVGCTVLGHARPGVPRARRGAGQQGADERQEAV